MQGHEKGRHKYVLIYIDWEPSIVPCDTWEQVRMEFYFNNADDKYLSLLVAEEGMLAQYQPSEYAEKHGLPITPIKWDESRVKKWGI